MVFKKVHQPKLEDFGLRRVLSCGRVYVVSLSYKLKWYEVEV